MKIDFINVIPHTEYLEMKRSILFERLDYAGVPMGSIFLTSTHSGPLYDADASYRNSSIISKALTDHYYPNNFLVLKWKESDNIGGAFKQIGDSITP